jgi:chemotaxis protein MotB
LDDELAAANAGSAGLGRQLAEARDGRAALESRLADETAARQTIQASLEQSRTRNRAIDDELIAAGARMAAVTRQLAALRAQIAELSGLLDASEGDNQEQQEVIADLGRRLNLALATKVRELAKYRSEFFGRLREVLGERSDVRIVGDRFVFQSEVLFRTGEAELEEPGREQLRRLAESLQQIADTIPSDIDWVLRIDGHTDERPIQTPRFPSNWELSTARAISVVRFLIEQGVPAKRVMAAGFAHFRPLVPGRDEAAFQRNRRIEFRLTQK